LSGGVAACDVGVGDGSNPLPIPGVFGDGGSGQGGAGSSSGGGSTTSTTSTSSVGGGGQGACDGGGPVIEAAGSNTKYLLKGTLLLPSGPSDGELLISGNVIDCIGSCAGDPQANGATVIQTNGVISPGLIDAHNHITYDVFDEDDWFPTETFTNHDQWPCSYPSDPMCRYGAMGDAKRYLNGEDSSPINVGCEVVKYGETRALIAGTTSVQGSPGGNNSCYGSIARSIDVTSNDLPADKIRTSVALPSATTADSVCQDLGDGSTTAFVVHIAEGVDTTARNEFDKLGTVSTVDGCLYDPATTIIHGVALNHAQIDIMATNGMSLVWSPKSNVFLYGAGTDLTKTADIPYYRQKGINIALGPDWTIGGSQNMLDEMRFADQVDNAVFGDILDAKELWEMATINSAKSLGVEQYLGSLEVGKRADIAVFLPSATGTAYDAVLEARPAHVTMVFVDGRLLYGDTDLQGDGPPGSVCETADICCRQKFLCLAETTGSPANRLDQTFADFETILVNAMQQYDDLNLSPWKFSPISPIVKCQ
jgi:hypothetical protein